MANSDSPEAFVYQDVPIKDEIESLENYRPGGFVPLKPGDTLEDRFLVLQKLGFGRTATVWLCQETATEKWFAIKVNSAETSGKDSRELIATRILFGPSVGQDHAGAAHVAVPLETFHTNSPNGRHLCSVMPVLGPSLMDWRRHHVLMDDDRARRLCLQAAEGLDFIHSKGLCHGDFRPQNIFMKLLPGCLDGKTRADMWKLLGEPPQAEVLSIDGRKSQHAPEWVVAPVSTRRLAKYATDDIAIIGLGEAYVPSTLKPLKALEIPAALRIPRAYTAPEAAFEAPGHLFGKGTDVWALACALLEVRRGERLGGSVEDVVRHTEWLVGEALPLPYRPAAERMLAEAKAQGDGDGGPPSLDERTIAALEASARDTEARTEKGLSLEPLMTPLNQILSQVQNNEASETTYTDPIEILVGRYMMDSELGPSAGTRLKPLKHKLPEQKVVDFVELLRMAFKYDQKDRISAREVVKHRWFTDEYIEVRPTIEDDSSPRGFPLCTWIVIAILSVEISLIPYIIFGFRATSLGTTGHRPAPAATCSAIFFT